MSPVRGSSLAFVTLLLAACSASQPGVAEITAGDLRSRVEHLAGPGTQGRAAGSQEAREVAAWIRSEFERIGLEPVDPKGAGDPGYLHRFEVPVARLANEHRNVLVIRRGGDETSIPAGRDWMPFSMDEPRCFRQGGGEVVVVGLGHDEGPGAWNDYGEAVEGRVAIAFRGIPPGTTDDYERKSAFAAKYDAARRHGATALLICNDPTWSRRNGDAIGFAGFEIEAADDLPCAYVSQRLARKILGCSKSEFLQLASMARKRPTCRIIPRTYVDLTIDVEIDRSAGIGENVLGMVPGTEQGTDGGFLVVGAHYDHLGRALDWKTTLSTLGGHDARGAVHPGADDNASGVAVLLELAEWFSEHQNRLPCPIVFVAFGSEEYRLLGSSNLILEPLFKNTLLMLNLDMVGRTPVGTISVTGAPSWEGLNAVVQAAAVTSGSRWPLCTSIETETGVANLPAVESDHQPFYEWGHPFLAITTGLGDDHYHRPSDRSRPLDYDAMLYVARVARAILLDLGSHHVDALRDAEAGSLFATIGAEMCVPLCRSCRELKGRCPDGGCARWARDLDRAIQALAAEGVETLTGVLDVDGVSVAGSGESVEALLVDAMRRHAPFDVVVDIGGSKTTVHITP